MSTGTRRMKELEIAAAALKEVGYEARPGFTSDGTPVLWHYDAEPPCDDTYRAFRIGVESLGGDYMTFNEWHHKQDRRRSCTCDNPRK